MQYESLLNESAEPENLAAVPPLCLFSPESISYVSALSALLMRNPQARQFPEITVVAFWLRKANIERLRREAIEHMRDALLLPRGTVFHLAPSNVDTIFLYSWILSLLVGNRNIIRLSSTPTEQSKILVDTVAELLQQPQHQEIARRTLIVRYPPTECITKRLSAVCDVRVVWGGDDTVRQIRQIPLPPTAIEIAFANKYSLALIESRSWLQAADGQKDEWVNAFYNDSYWFDQMACSSPRLLLWVGENSDRAPASAEFWSRLESVVKERNKRLSDADYINKFVAATSLALESNVTIPKTISNDLVRVCLQTPALHETRHCGAGLFFESSLPDLESLRPILGRTIQTVSYAGFSLDELRTFVMSGPPLAGIDRVVPMGHALDFAVVWDGFNLLRTFTREITVA